ILKNQGGLRTNQILTGEILVAQVLTAGAARVQTAPCLPPPARTAANNAKSPSAPRATNQSIAAIVLVNGKKDKITLVPAANSRRAETFLLQDQTTPSPMTNAWT